MAFKKKEEVVAEAPLLVVDLSEEKVKVTVPDTKKVALVAPGVVITKEIAEQLIEILNGSCSKSNNVPFRKNLKRLIGALSDGINKAG